MASAADRFEADAAAVRAGHEADAAALASLLALPRGEATLAAQRRVERATITRGPEMEALRRAVRSRPDAVDAQKHVAVADAHYWSMVLRHDGIVRQQAYKIGKYRAKDTDPEDILTIVRVGWFAAALRFDPDRGLRFPTMAVNWALARVQRERDLPGGIKPARNRNFGARVLPLDTPLRGDGELTLLDTLASDAEGADEAWERAHDVADIATHLSGLPERERGVVLRCGRGEITYSKLAVELGLSRERVRQIATRGFGKLRAVMLQENIAAMPIPFDTAADTDDTPRRCALATLLAPLPPTLPNEP